MLGIFAKYYFWVNKFWLAVEFSRQATATGPNLNTAVSYIETFCLRCFRWNRKKLLVLLQEVVEHGELTSNLGVIKSSGWNYINKTPKRLHNTLYLPRGIWDELEQEIKSFTASKAWYLQRGIPYRKGFLFSGIPGTGKSSLVLTLATYFKMDVGILKLASATPEHLMSISAIQATNLFIILIEEVDTLFKVRNKKDSKVAFGDFLNLLDGADSPQDCIFIMTTNHPEKLDPALIRPGRIDHHFKFGYADSYQIKNMFKDFFDSSDDLAQQFANKCNVNITTATLQGYFLKYKDQVLEAFRNIEELGEAEREAEKLYLLRVAAKIEQAASGTKESMDFLEPRTV